MNASFPRSCSSAACSTCSTIGAGSSIILAVAVAICETRRTWAYMSGAHALIIASKASSAEHPWAPPRLTPGGDTESENVVGFTRGDIIEG